MADISQRQLAFKKVQDNSKRRPSDSDFRAANNNLPKTPGQTAQQMMQGNFSTLPNFNAANDNSNQNPDRTKTSGRNFQVQNNLQKETEQGTITRTGVVDKTNVVTGAFGKEEKAADSGPQLSDDAAKNLSKEDAALLDQTQVKRKPVDNDGLGLTADNDNAQDFNNLENSDEQNYENEFGARQTNSGAIAAALTLADQKDRREKYLQIIKSGFEAEKIPITDEEALKLIDTNFHVKFPFITFFMCLIFEMGQATFGVMTLILDFVIFPVGMMLTIFGVIISACKGIFFYFWMNYYAKNASDFTSNIPFLKRVVLRIIFRRSWLLLLGLIPEIGDFLPVQTFMVYMTYRSIKKTSEKAEKILEQGLSQSGFQG